MDLIPVDKLNELRDIVIDGVLIYVSIIVLTRLMGLRTYSKMTTFDFAITVAIGSVVASGILMLDVGFVRTFITLVTLLFLQWLVSKSVSRWSRFEKLVTNKPILLVKDGIILHKNLLKIRVSEDELYTKLRSAGVHSLKEVDAAVMETTADISVIKKSEGRELQPDMLTGVIDDQVS